MKTFLGALEFSGRHMPIALCLLVGQGHVVTDVLRVVEAIAKC